MDVVSSCPLRAWSFLWQSHDRRFAQTVVVKGTFKLTPGQVALAEEQDPPNAEDKVPYKPRADVVLVGHAFAPGKTPVRSLLTRLAVGDLDKSIEVFSDRGFRQQDGQLLEGPRFSQMPLRWERAAGGPDTQNPVGMRFDAPADVYGMVPIPNLQPSGIFVSKRSDTFAPVGYGPVAPSWPGRTRRLGRLAGTFSLTGWEEKPLPEGLDPAFFQAAPPDQQVAELRSNERIVLENLHPEHPRLVTSLPGMKPKAMVARATGEREEVKLVADTLWIDTDRGMCVVVWRGSLGLRHAAEAGRISVLLEEGGAGEVGMQDLATPKAGEREGLKEAVGMTLLPDLGAQPNAPVMPFLGADRPPASAASAPAYVPPPLIVASRESLWAPGASGPSRETIGSAAVAAATAAVAMPSADRASQEGAVAASNAAAGAAPWSVPKRDLRAVAAEGSALQAQPARELLQLLWYDPKSIARMRRVPAWRKVFEDLERSPRSREVEIVDGARDPWEIEDREEVFEVLAKAPRLDARGLDEALEGAIGEDGKFVPPLVVLEGEIEMPFDELDTLKAAMSVAVPMVTAADEGLKAAVAAARDFVSTPGLLAAPAVCEGLTVRIREAISKEKKGVPADYLDKQVERVLAVGRCYQRREVFGGVFLRCLIWLPGEAQAVVGYLPKGAGRRLPMGRRFRGRVVGEVWLGQGGFEWGGTVTKVIGVGRSVAGPSHRIGQNPIEGVDVSLADNAKLEVTK